MMKTNLDDDTQKVRCYASSSLTEEHLEHHQPTTIIDRSILYVFPLESLLLSMLLLQLLK